MGSSQQAFQNIVTPFVAVIGIANGLDVFRSICGHCLDVLKWRPLARSAIYPSTVSWISWQCWACNAGCGIIDVSMQPCCCILSRPNLSRKTRTAYS